MQTAHHIAGREAYRRYAAAERGTHSALPDLGQRASAPCTYARERQQKKTRANHGETHGKCRMTNAAKQPRITTKQVRLRINIQMPATYANPVS